MKKIFATVIILFSMISSVFADMPVIDLTAMMNAIKNLYATYDEINNMIESVQNGYQQIQQAANAVMSLKDFSAAAFSEWSSDGGLAGAWENIGIARQRMQQANGYVSDKIAKTKELKDNFANSSMNFNGTNYTLKDLLGVGEEGKTIFGLASNMAQFGIDRYKDSARAYTEGLTQDEREQIWKQFGMSPDMYYMEQMVEGLVEGSVMGAVPYLNIDGFEDAFNKDVGETLQQLEAFQVAAENGESEVAHIDSLRQTEVEIYKSINNVVFDLKNLLAINASKEVKEQMQREQELVRKKTQEVERALDNLHYSTPYISPGL